MGKKNKKKNQDQPQFNPIENMYKLLELTVNTINDNVNETPEKFKSAMSSLSEDLERALNQSNLSPENYFVPIEREPLPTFKSLSDYIEDK